MTGFTGLLVGTGGSLNQTTLKALILHTPTDALRVIPAAEPDRVPAVAALPQGHGAGLQVSPQSLPRCSRGLAGALLAVSNKKNRFKYILP